MHLQLTILTGHLHGHQLHFDVGPAPLLIGRDVQACTLTLDGQLLSATHASIRSAGGQVLIRDLDSKNGTFLNGKRLPPQQDVRLPERGLLQLGCQSLEFFISAAPALPAARLRLRSWFTLALAASLALLLAWLLLKDAPASSAKPPADSAKPPADSAKPPADSAKPPAPTAIPPAPTATQELVRLQITSEPAGAVLTLNAQAAGLSPAILTLPRNEAATLRLNLPGHNSLSTTLFPQEDAILSFDLVRSPGSVQIDSHPAGAAILLAGRELGRTPAMLGELPEGPLRLALVLEGFQDGVLALDSSREAAPLNLSHHFTASGSTTLLSIHCPTPRASIFLDDTLVTVLTDQQRSLDLADIEPGEHTLRAVAPDNFDSASISFTLKATDQLSVTLSPYYPDTLLELTDGRRRKGMVVSEDARQLSLQEPSGTRITIPLTQIKSRQTLKPAELFRTAVGAARIIALNPAIWLPDRRRYTAELAAAKPASTQTLLDARRKLSLADFQKSYRNQPLLVTGTVSAISADPGCISLTLDKGLECYFYDLDQNKAQSRLGKKITLRGYCLGLKGLDRIVCTDCRLE